MAPPAGGGGCGGGEEAAAATTTVPAKLLASATSEDRTELHVGDVVCAPDPTWSGAPGMVFEAIVISLSAPGDDSDGGGGVVVDFGDEDSEPVAVPRRSVRKVLPWDALELGDHVEASRVFWFGPSFPPPPPR